MKKFFFIVAMIVISGNPVMSQQNVGIGTTSPAATLDVIRGAAAGGTSMFRGTNYNSRFNYSDNEHTYIRGGKPGSYVLLNDSSGLGNVGIGTSSPDFKLTVQTPPDSWGIIHNTGTIGVGTWAGYFGGINGGWYGTYSDHPLMFSTNNGGAQMTLLQNGNVGINTVSPSAKLDVQKNFSDIGTAALRGTLYGSYFNYYSTEDTYISGGKAGSHLYLNSSGPLGNVVIGAGLPTDKLSIYTPSDNYGVTHTDGLITVGSWVGGGAGWYGTKTNHPLNFFTNSGNAQMTIQANGQVSINGGPGMYDWMQKLTVNGGITLIRAGSPYREWNIESSFFTTNTLNFRLNGSSKAYVDENGDWIPLSDIGLKESVSPFKLVLEDIRKLKVSTYRYKSNPKDSRSFGLIAQDVAQYFPE